MNRDLSLVEACLHLDISSVSTTTKKLIFQISIIYILLYLKESKVQVLFLYEVKIGQLFLFVNKENRKCGVTGTSLFTFSCCFLLFLLSLLLPAVTARECGLLLHLCSREKQTNAGLYDLLYSNNENCFDFWHFLGQCLCLLGQSYGDTFKMMVSFLMMMVKHVRWGKEVNSAGGLLWALVDLCRFFTSLILLYLLHLFSCLCLDQTPFQNNCRITWILTKCTAKCLTWIS